jgi:hypothetical protein
VQYSLSAPAHAPEQCLTGAGPRHQALKPTENRVPCTLLAIELLSFAKHSPRLANGVDLAQPIGLQRG